MGKEHSDLSKFLPSVAAVALLLVVALGISAYVPKNSKLAPSTAHASGIAITGWAWSSSVGWVSFSGTAANGATYGVTVGSGGALSGYAWNNSIGWINFGANSCGAAPTLANGVLTGFAQAINTGGDGCIALYGVANNGTVYNVSLSGTTFTGYAWASDTIGWLSFSGTAGGTSYSVTYGGSPTPSCALSVSPNPAATGSSININYTTTNSPTTGTITDAGGNTLTTTAINSSGAVGATAPSTPGSYNYTMTVTSPSGSASCSTAPTALVTQTDICSNISGLQSSWSDPNGYISGTNCLCNSGYTLSGTQCVVVPNSSSIVSFSGPTRVRSGSTATLTYNITNPLSCSISGTNGYTSSAITSTVGSVTTTGYPITASTKFTLSCTGTSQSIIVGITPSFYEQ